MCETFFFPFSFFRVEAQTKMTMIKERADKDIFMYNIEIKELERIIAHECRLKEYMTTKCNERSGQDDTQDTGPSQCKCTYTTNCFCFFFPEENDLNDTVAMKF